MRSRKLEALASRCLIMGFDGPDLSGDARRLVSSGAGGVILFRRNVEEAAQVRELTDSIRAASSVPVLLTVDQEGGRVARLRGMATDLPAMRDVGSFGPETAERVGRMMAIELTALGFDMVHAPVADVDTNPANPIIGDRAFHSDPAEVARLVTAFVAGLEGAGVAGCGKHFPGHGDTELDSHLALPRVSHDRARLDAIELVPFAALAKAGVASIMTAHIVVEAIDPLRPATMSPDVLDILRHDLGYEGLLMTDDMEMEAIAGRHDLGDAAVQALAAGCDQVLVCHRADRQERVVEALARAAMDGQMPAARLEEAVSRVDSVAARFRPERSRPRPADALRTAEHLSLAEALFGGRPQVYEKPIEPDRDR